MITPPSKKVLSVFILAAAVVAASILAFGRDKAGVAINYASNLVAGEKVSIPENPDWQNELIKVAPSGAEPSDTGVQAKETVTDQVSRTLISNYLSLKQNGNLDTESAQELIDQTIEYLERSGGQFTKITRLQLNVISDNGKQSITDYGERLGTIAKGKKPKEIQNELNLLIQIVKSEDSARIAELDKIIASYEKIGDELVKMPVPKTFIKAHLDITNGVRGMAWSLKEMRNSLNDPFKSLAALQIYGESITYFSMAMEATVDFLVQSKIVYKQGSGGYYLLYEI